MITSISARMRTHVTEIRIYINLVHGRQGWKNLLKFRTKRSKIFKVTKDIASVKSLNRRTKLLMGFTAATE